MNNGIGIVKIADLVKDFLEKEFEKEPPEIKITIARSYLETFDWNTTETVLLVCPDSSTTSYKAHGRLQREATIVVLLYKNLAQIGDAQTEEIDSLVGILERLNALFCQNAEVAQGVNLYADRMESSTEGLYSVDALTQGRFIGALQLTAFESF